MTTRPATQRRMANRLYDEALLDLHSRRWREADIRLRRVLDLNPTYPGAARRLRELEAWQRAESDFRRGRRCAEEKHWLEAIAWFDHAIAAIGEYPEASNWKRACQSELRREQAKERSALSLVLNRKVMASVTACALTLCSMLSSSQVILPLPASRVAIKTEPDSNQQVPQLSPAAPSPIPADDEMPDEVEATPIVEESVTPSATPAAVQSAPSATPVVATARPTATRRPAPVVVLGPTATPTRPRATRTPTPVRLPATSTATRSVQPTSADVPTSSATATPAPSSTATPAGGVILVVTSSPTPAPSSTPRPTGTPTSSVVQLAISAGEYFFSPAEIVVRSGSTVRIRFANGGNMTHRWRLLNAAGRVLFEISAGPRSEATGLFAAPPPGRYLFECPLDDHAERGMRGTLTVQ